MAAGEMSPSLRKRDEGALSTGGVSRLLRSWALACRFGDLCYSEVAVTRTINNSAI